MSNWISTQQELPPVQKGLVSLSEDVQIKFADGTVKKGFYNYRTARWHTGDARSFGRPNITHWRPLSEVSNE